LIHFQVKINLKNNRHHNVKHALYYTTTLSFHGTRDKIVRIIILKPDLAQQGVPGLESGVVYEKIEVFKNSVDPAKPGQKLGCTTLIIFFTKITSF